MKKLVEIKKSVYSDKNMLLLRSGAIYSLENLCRWVAEGKLTYEQLLEATSPDVMMSGYFYQETDEVLKFAPEETKQAAKKVLDSIKPRAISIADEIRRHSFWTFSHSMRVCIIAVAIATAIGVNEEEVALVSEGALLHDIGKTTIPSSILNKKGQLSEEEFRCMRGHAYNGYTLLKEKGYSYGISQFALLHHERKDGNGYYHYKNYSPLVEIVGLADTLDAMCSERPYSQPLSIEEAFAKLEVENAKENLFTNSIFYKAKTTLCYSLINA